MGVNKSETKTKTATTSQNDNAQPELVVQGEAGPSVQTLTGDAAVKHDSFTLGGDFRLTLGLEVNGLGKSERGVFGFSAGLLGQVERNGPMLTYDFDPSLPGYDISHPNSSGVGGLFRIGGGVRVGEQRSTQLFGQAQLDFLNPGKNAALVRSGFDTSNPLGKTVPTVGLDLSVQQLMGRGNNFGLGGHIGCQFGSAGMTDQTGLGIPAGAVNCFAGLVISERPTAHLARADDVDYYYHDKDRDTFGDNESDLVPLGPNVSRDGYSKNNLDCNDQNYGVNPDQTEIPCNDADDDCNPTTLDDTGHCEDYTHYPDVDADGFGDKTGTPKKTSSVTPPPGYSNNNRDCDDSNEDVNPEATEIPCNDTDDDCDRKTPDDDGTCNHVHGNSGTDPVAGAVFTKDRLNFEGKINFDTNRDTLRPDSIQILDNIGGAIMAELAETVGRPDALVLIELQGHADPRNTDAHNLDLSQRRAETAVKYLYENFDIPKGLLVAKGFGERVPFTLKTSTGEVSYALNTDGTATEDGRTLAKGTLDAWLEANRRVEIHVWRQGMVNEGVTPGTVVPPARTDKTEAPSKTDASDVLENQGL